MTSNVRNRGTAHLAFRAGSIPFCKNRKAHIVVAVEDRAKWEPGICARCAAKADSRKSQPGVRP